MPDVTEISVSFRGDFMFAECFATTSEPKCEMMAYALRLALYHCHMQYQSTFTGRGEGGGMASIIITYSTLEPGGSSSWPSLNGRGATSTVCEMNFDRNGQTVEVCYQPKEVPIALRPPRERKGNEEKLKVKYTARTWWVDNSGGWAVSDIVATILTIVACP
jgi:hypothetical protein